MEMKEISFGISGLPGIIYGAGSAAGLGKYSQTFGNTALLVTGGESYDRGTFRSKIENSLKRSGISWFRYPVTNEPSPNIVDKAVAEHQGCKIDLVIAVGGGSVLDAGKAISAMFCEKGSVRDYLEDIGIKKVSGKRLPLLALPTTAGTGSEATKNTVLSVTGNEGYKKSLRHDNYLPDIALVDPELTLDCPVYQSVASGMDAFTQLLESYLSTRANPFTDCLALSGLRCVSDSLYHVFKEPDNLDARAGMAYAALLSGITLANAGLGLIHGFAQPLGSLFPVPHGTVCATLMGIVNRKTVEKLRNEDEPVTYLNKYSEAGKLFSGKSYSQKTDYINILLDEIDFYTCEFKIPGLSDYGIKSSDIDVIIKHASHKNHPVIFDNSEIESILRKRL